MFTRSTYKIMKMFTSIALMEQFFEQYIYENAEAKVKELIGKVETSKEANRYLQFLVQQGRLPLLKELGAVLNSSAFFVFSKAQTVCAGGLFFIHNWQATVNPFSDNDILDDQKVTDLMVDFIVQCNQMKFKVSENFFDRFYDRVHKLALEEGIE